jgi:ferritin-like metal-binding protein YciE
MATKTSIRKAGNKSPQINEKTKSALQELFVEELKDIYWAEQHLVKALPKMKEAATSEELQNAIQTHFEETQEQVIKLEGVFDLMGEKAEAKKCEAMAGLVEEGKSIVKDTEDNSATRDVGIILASQKIEHYEIATYGGLTQLAKTLGLDDAADILGEILAEEKKTDQLLTEIAENNINYEASEEEA